MVLDSERTLARLKFGLGHQDIIDALTNGAIHSQLLLLGYIQLPELSLVPVVGRPCCRAAWIPVTGNIP